ncbi:MAG: DUF2760 domain-containing protein [Desulfobacterales bacterium]|jgi:hypothetical protein|nr:DUF2760 domain-containing protein [Desulfobacterales bacterium]
MNHASSFTLKCLYRIAIIMMLIALFFTVSGIWIWRLIFSFLPLEILQGASSHSSELATGLAAVMPILNMLEYCFIPSVFFILICGALILCLMMRRLFIRSTAHLELNPRLQTKGMKASKTDKVKPLKESLKDLPLPSESESPGAEKKDDLEFTQRLYLHVLSVLQRDGRLLDFLSENLNNYEDHQIGSAVRNIHENCKKALNKYLKPSAVIDKNEGEEVIVPRNFDISSIKLTGKVVNEPPFQGVLRHKGWQVARLELPTLTPGQNPRIIAPAEVEIL